MLLFLHNLKCCINWTLFHRGELPQADEVAHEFHASEPAGVQSAGAGLEARGELFRDLSAACDFQQYGYGA